MSDLTKEEETPSEMLERLIEESAQENLGKSVEEKLDDLGLSDYMKKIITEHERIKDKPDYKAGDEYLVLWK